MQTAHHKHHCMLYDLPAYEEQFSLVSRQIQRAYRLVRYTVRKRLGLPLRILVEIRWRLGDEVMALPVYDALRKIYPDAQIAVLCNYPDLLLDSDAVDKINPASFTPDVYCMLRGTPRDVVRIEQYRHRAHIPEAFPVCCPTLAYSSWDSPLLDELESSTSRCVALTMGASWPAKQWPIESWREVVATLNRANVTTVQVGTDEPDIGCRISYVGRTTVREAACVLHAMDVLVCPDTGLMHLARAVQTEVVALFGPTDPNILISDDPDLHVITCACPQQGCWNHDLSEREPGACPAGRDDCLSDIPVDRVIQTIMRILSG